MPMQRTLFLRTPSHYVCRLLKLPSTKHEGYRQKRRGWEVVINLQIHGEGAQGV
jgi:hypothetical protein